MKTKPEIIRLCAAAGMLVLAALLQGGCQGGNGTFSQPKADDAGFEAGRSRTPTPNTMYALSKMLAAQGKDSQCQQVLVELIRKYPDFVPAYSDLAELQLRHERPAEATRVLEVGLKIAPSNPVLLNNLGMCHLLRGQYDQALASFTRATELAPLDARYRSNMAVALGMAGRDEEARSLFEQVVSAEQANRNIEIIRQARQKTE